VERAVSLDRAAVEIALRDFAIAAHPGVWVFANEPGDRPPRPYGTIFVRSANAIGAGDSKSIANGIQITEQMREVFELEVSIQAYGRDALEVISDLKTWARRPSVVIGTLQTVLLGFLSAGPTQDLSQVISQDWEGRAQCDFRFTARFNADLTINTIGTVEISGAGTTQTIEEP
jgi:hypothetical protein